MVTPAQIGWSSYSTFEGPYFGGTVSYALPPNPTDNDKWLAVITGTEGGHFDAVNAYDRMIISAGIIQWGEASIYGVSDLLGAVGSACPSALAYLQPALAQSNAVFKQDAKGKWRFFQGGAEVLTLAGQHRLFQGKSDGTKGSWDANSKQYAKVWASSVANVLAQPGALEPQVTFTTSRMMPSFVTATAKTALWGPSDPTDNTGLVGALRAAYISFGANLPAVASAQLTKAIAGTSAPKWSLDWVVAILKGLTFGPQIAIYPGRYNKIRPILESLYGVNLPDMAADLKAWQAGQGVDPSSNAPSFITTESVQNELITEGYDLGPSGADGSYGARTKDAVVAFQKAHGLQADGVVGPATRKALVAEFLKRNPD